ncbi:hypothetical protein FA13DRAFT_96498 [Coprinellus micaceus]|uniref:Peptidase S8/S53 domain-containing protein n=1 Tax=Coprinellus micaceus TaxID=71717 RepID=A0A4Y7SIJ8_COPMI|nr:hypothetical protein FA13DRAFT_96498 [Coprinellus micaceus]
MPQSGLTSAIHARLKGATDLSTVGPPVGLRSDYRSNKESSVAFPSYGLTGRSYTQVSGTTAFRKVTSSVPRLRICENIYLEMPQHRNHGHGTHVSGLAGLTVHSARCLYCSVLPLRPHV